MPVIIDPRRHDAVLFDLETDLGSTLAARLRDVGVGTAVVPADGPARAAADLKVRPGRAVVVAGAAAGVRPPAPPDSRR